MRWNYVGLPLVFVALAASAQTPPAPTRQSTFGSTVGYLAQTDLPDDKLLVPAAPIQGSPADARDAEASRAALALRGSARWELATRDADLGSPASTFSCALGVELTAQNAPRADSLLRRTMVDLSGSTNGAKALYKRSRPFTVNATPICTPAQEQVLRTNGSYPSGHSAIGWGLALVLAELAPDRANQLLPRGLAFGKSRMVCNVHWLSDVEAGRIAAAALVARLHAVPEFRSDLEAARTELAAVRAAGNQPAQARCEQEKMALAAD